MAKATRKSTRLQKTKQDPDFLSGLQLEDLEDQFEAFKFPSLPPLSPSKSPSSQKKTADSSPRKEQEDVASGGVDLKIKIYCTTPPHPASSSTLLALETPSPPLVKLLVHRPSSNSPGFIAHVNEEDN